MRVCVLCEGPLSHWGECRSCGLSSDSSKEEGDYYVFVFQGNRKVRIPTEDNLSMGEFILKYQDSIFDLISNAERLSIGYFKERMCPFTQVKVGGTRLATQGFSKASVKDFVWSHSECIKEYCAIWDPGGSQCSIKTIAENFGHSSKDSGKEEKAKSKFIAAPD